MAKERWAAKKEEERRKKDRPGRRKGRARGTGDDGE
jgi:hypothetical protein